MASALTASRGEEYEFSRSLSTIEEFRSALPRRHDDGGAGVVGILQGRHPLVWIRTGGTLNRRLATGVDRGRWSARFSPRMEIAHCQGFGSVRKSSRGVALVD